MSRLFFPGKIYIRKCQTYWFAALFAICGVVVASCFYLRFSGSGKRVSTSFIPSLVPHHENVEAIQLLDDMGIVRRLQRIKPFEPV
jgi:hypothetical protein